MNIQHWKYAPMLLASFILKSRDSRAGNAKEVDEFKLNDDIKHRNCAQGRPASSFQSYILHWFQEFFEKKLT